MVSLNELGTFARNYKMRRISGKIRLVKDSSPDRGGLHLLPELGRESLPRPGMSSLFITYE